MRAHVVHHQNEYARVLASVIETGDRWLDIGAGTRVHDGWVGVSAVEVSGRASFLVGVDLEIDHLTLNNNINAGVAASAYSLPFTCGSFSVVTANMVLEHIEDPRNFFQELYRVVIPEGRIVFVTPNLKNPTILLSRYLLSSNVRSRLASIVERRPMEHVFPTFYRANTIAAIGSFLPSDQWEIVELRTFFSLPFLQQWKALMAIEQAAVTLLGRLTGSTFGTNIICVARKR